MRRASKSFSLVLCLIVTFGSCKHKPAYSEMDPEAMKSQNRNAEARAAATSAQSAPSNPQTSGAAQPPIKRPSFLGTDGGTIRDLPDYPGGRRQNIIMGPNQGANVMSLAMTAKDPLDRIATFYEQVIKTNRWTLVDKLADPEYYEWNLKKGDNDTAKIAVKKDAQSGLTIISIVRSEKMEESAK